MTISLVEARERALEALIKARALTQPDGTVRAEDEATFDAHMATFKTLDRQAWLGNGGTGPETPQTVEEAYEAYTGTGAFRPTGLPGGLPFPSGSSGGTWGSAFVAARAALTGGQFNAALLESGSTAINPSLRTMPVDDPRRTQFLYKLFGEVPAPTGRFSYLKQASRDLNAAVVPIGTPKPVSTFTYERIDDVTKVIAHITDPVDRYTIEEARLLSDFIDRELRYGVDLALDAIVVAALIAESTAGGALDLAGVRAAITTLQLAEIEPNVVALNPTDWEAIEEEARGQDESRNEAAVRKLHGVPVLVTTSIDEGTGLVGLATTDTGEIHVTGGVRIDVSDSTPRVVGDDTVNDFRLNQLVFRAERKAELALMQPTAFVALTGGS